MAKVLYISYDGISDALGQSQVLNYLKKLSLNYCHEITLISFEKKENLIPQYNKLLKIVTKHKIKWIPLTYHKQPPIVSTYYDYLILKKQISNISDTFDIIHCRGYIAGLAGLWTKKKHNKKFIFDMRGFWADEKKEGGHWNKFYYAPVYHFFKLKEKQFFNKADIIVSLTHIGKKEIEKNYTQKEICVIPTCVDFNTFSPFDEETRNKVRKRLQIPLSAKVLIYSGSIGGNYSAEIIINTFIQFKQLYPDAHFIILAKTIEENLIIPDNIKNNIHILSVPYIKVHEYLKAADIGLIYYKTGYSLIGRNPTKMWEYLSQGLPVIINGHNQDIANFIYNHPESGIIASEEYEEDNAELLKKLKSLSLNNDRFSLRKLIQDYFSVKSGAQKYHKIYQELSE